ncbi:MAG: sugar transferase [Pseudomonadota bacterium]
MTAHSAKITASSAVVPTQQHSAYAIIFKRILDVLIVVLALPFLVPFFLVACLFIALDGNSPFFVQERVGMHGKRFMMWKFRTMVPDAEDRLEQYLAENEDARIEWRDKQKLNDDPRVTFFGNILRRTSMDELPQMINVLLGDMSLVGPRPMLPSQQALYEGHGYYRLRPGVTGIWQVTARNSCNFAERAKYDDEYEARVGFLTDASIFARTVGVVLRGTGV